eukprot:1153940-Pelagomonas_calceolata.AAC.2
MQNHTYFVPMIRLKSEPCHSSRELAFSLQLPELLLDIECTCNYLGGYKPVNSEPLTLDTTCLDEIDAADAWAYPTCADLNDANKIDRKLQCREELMRVIWMPSWNLEETYETWTGFQQRLLEFEANQSEPDLS